MRAENPVATTVRYIDDGWRTAHPARLRAEILSIVNETHRWVDNGSMIISKGELIDPETGKIIDFPRKTYIQKKEGDFMDTLRIWANSGNKEEIGLWLSPLYEDTYPYNKVCIYEKKGDRLFTTAIVFNTPKNHCLEIGKMINPLIEYVHDPEVLRDKLFIRPADFDLVSVLQIIATPGVGQKQTFSQELMDYFVKEIHSGRDARSIALEMQQLGLIGDYGTSCPPAMNALTLNFTGEKYVRNCGNCGVVIGAFIGKGYRCKSCGGIFEGC